MRLRNKAALAFLGLTVIGCGPPEIVPMTPPGVTYRKIVADNMEAEGENRNKGTIQPKTSSDGVKPTPFNGPEVTPAPTDK